jgi:hypothetical protein
LGSNASNQPIAAALQGNGTKVQLSTGTTTSNDCVKFDANGNTVDAGAACGSGGGAPILSSITAATSGNTIASGNNSGQIWNWALTSPSVTAFTFGETTAATGASDLLLAANTLAGSTAIPLTISNSLTGSQTLPTLQVIPVYNTTGVVDAGILEKASGSVGAGSLLIDLQMGGVSQLKTDTTGNLTAAGTGTFGGTNGNSTGAVLTNCGSGAASVFNPTFMTLGVGSNCAPSFSINGGPYGTYLGGVVDATNFNGASYTGTGTITLTNASLTVTGSGTSFANSNTGALLIYNSGTAPNFRAPICSFTNATSITLCEPFPGATASGITMVTTAPTSGQAQIVADPGAAVNTAWNNTSGPGAAVLADGFTGTQTATYSPFVLSYNVQRNGTLHFGGSTWNLTNTVGINTPNIRINGLTRGSPTNGGLGTRFRQTAAFATANSVNTGTIAVTNGSGTVLGTGTAFNYTISAGSCTVINGWAVGFLTLGSAPTQGFAEGSDVTLAGTGVSQWNVRAPLLSVSGTGVAISLQTSSCTGFTAISAGTIDVITRGLLKGNLTVATGSGDAAGTITTSITAVTGSGTAFSPSWVGNTMLQVVTPGAGSGAGCVANANMTVVAVVNSTTMTAHPPLTGNCAAGTTFNVQHFIQGSVASTSTATSLTLNNCAPNNTTCPQSLSGMSYQIVQPTIATPINMLLLVNVGFSDIHVDCINNPASQGIQDTGGQEGSYYWDISTLSCYQGLDIEGFQAQNGGSFVNVSTTSGPSLVSDPVTSGVEIWAQSGFRGIHGLTTLGASGLGYAGVHLNGVNYGIVNAHVSGYANDILGCDYSSFCNGVEVDQLYPGPEGPQFNVVYWNPPAGGSKTPSSTIRVNNVNTFGTAPIYGNTFVDAVLSPTCAAGTTSLGPTSGTAAGTGSNYYLTEYMVGAQNAGSTRNRITTDPLANQCGSAITLLGSTSGSAILSATATGGTLNLGSTNATVTSGGAASFTGLTNTGFGAGAVMSNSSGVLSSTQTPTLGASGTLGSISFGNATSGTLTVQPVTGPLGATTLLLPVAAGSGIAAQRIASSTAVMGTSAIASGACATVVTVAAAGVTTADVINVGFNTDPTTPIAGYGQSATGAVLTIYPYPTAGNVNFRVCNSTSASITPGALTLNWIVLR